MTIPDRNCDFPVRSADQLSNITAVILAGGNSRRMGSDKALLPFAGLRLIDHVYRTLKGRFAEVLLVTDRGREIADLDCRKVVDIVPEGGVLAGIHSALVHAGQEKVFVAACDMPFISETVISRICALNSRGEVILPYTRGGHEPLHAIYSKSCLPVIEELLDAGQRRVGALFSRVQVVQIGADAGMSCALWERSFLNINTPEDYVSLCELAKV